MCVLEVEDCSWLRDLLRYSFSICGEGGGGGFGFQKQKQTTTGREWGATAARVVSEKEGGNLGGFTYSVVLHFTNL